MSDEMQGILRIGELSKRTGVSPELLRAWERRYGVLMPERSEGGFRLYSSADEERIRRMKRHLAEGLSAAEAAGLAVGSIDEPAQSMPAESPLDDLAIELAAALDRYDESAAQQVFDRLFSKYTAELVLRDVILPYLDELGQRWESGRIHVAQEHFASNVIKGRLLSMSRGWESGDGKLALLACLPGELHELGLLCFGISLRNQGWRIAYLGPDTPMESLARAAETIKPAAVVIAGTTSERFTEQEDAIKALSSGVPVVLAARGATRDFASSVGARVLFGDAVSAAAAL